MMRLVLAIVSCSLLLYPDAGRPQSREKPSGPARMIRSAGTRTRLRQTDFGAPGSLLRFPAGRFV
jgi:hypothetical protein